ncbi:MAG: hypothetical protein HZA72_01775 [Candidatus Omnitrophica bacterium]|nr:hypothetical protein [Candidatus Omnitrophota bacterium]
MAKRIVLSIVIFVFIFLMIGNYAAALEGTKDRASKAMDNIFLGPTEIADNLDETKSKGTEVEGCTEKTRTGVERGIARLVSGVWQLATFWYSDPNASSSGSSK